MYVVHYISIHKGSRAGANGPRLGASGNSAGRMDGGACYERSGISPEIHAPTLAYDAQPAVALELVDMVG